MDTFLIQLFWLVAGLFSQSSACVNDDLWDLVTCGYVAKMRMTEATDICSSTNTMNRDRIIERFTECITTYKYNMCSDEQKEGYVIDRFQEALNAIPCTITTTTGCVGNTLNCIIDSAKKVAEQTTTGLPCFCKHRGALLEEFNNCLESPEADLDAANCAVSNTENTTLQDAIGKLRLALADKNCSEVNTGLCSCWETLHNCIYGPKENMGGEFTTFLEHQWSLIDVAALQTSDAKLEETRAWLKYDQCRTDGFPDQYARAVKCLEANISSQCNIEFPMTLAYAEHFSNTTFYQTSGAALKNVEQFCSVWCRNTTLWTGEMVNCLSSFHPENMAISRSNIISYILNAPSSELKEICDNEKLDPSKPLDKQLNCSANSIDRCFYLPYHLVIAAEYQFEHTLTASDAMEALYRILLACEVDVVEWAENVIQSGVRKATDYSRVEDRGLTSFFGGSSSIFDRKEVTFLIVTVVLFATMVNTRKISSLSLLKY